MGLTEWFLGNHFFVAFHQVQGGCTLNQLVYAAKLVKQFYRDSWEPTPTATPYQSGVPIDSIAPSTDGAYQCLIGSFGWLATVLHPDLAAVHSFLSSYSSKPSLGQMSVVLFAIHYIPLTHNHRIIFVSSAPAPINTYIHFMDSVNNEAYSDSNPPPSDLLASLTMHSNACWGSQIGLAVHDGTLLLLFRFQSMSGGIIFHKGGPIAWIAVQQEKTSLSSCEAKICATNKISKISCSTAPPCLQCLQRWPQYH